MSGLITDSIGNFLTKIRNASRARKELVYDSHSKVKEGIALILAKKGFIRSYEIYTKGRFPVLMIHLHPNRGPLSIKRMSKPGQRLYRPSKEIRPVRRGLGIGIYSTSQGLFTDSEARKAKVGGEYICEIF